MLRKFLYSFLLLNAMNHASILKDMESHKETIQEVTEYLEDNLEDIADESYMVGFSYYVMKNKNTAPESWIHLFEEIIYVLKSENEEQYQERIRNMFASLNFNEFSGKVEMLIGDRDDAQAKNPQIFE